MYTGVLSKWVLTKLLGKSLNDWVISMLLYEKYLMLSVFFPIITSQIMPLTFKIVHPVSTSTVRLSVLCWQLSSISILLLICPTIIQLLINYVLCQKIGPQRALGVLCSMLVCFYSFRLEFCFQMSVSGSLTAASEKVDKPLRCLSGKCMVEHCLLYAHFIL